MNNSSVTEILKSFTRKELKRFVSFAESPYFNTSKATTRLLKELVKFYPKFEEAGIDKRKLFAGIYGKTKYSDSLLRKLNSNLIKLSIEFITTENAVFKEYAGLKGLRTKKLYKFFLKEQKQADQKYSDIIIDSDVILKNLFVTEEKIFFLYEKDRYREFTFERNQAMELIFLLFMLGFSENYLKKKNLFLPNKNNEFQLIDIIAGSIDFDALKAGISKTGKITKDISIHLIDLIKLSQTKDENLYREIKEFCFDYSEKHPSDIIHIGYVYLMEYISFKIESGEKQYHKERLEIYKKVEKDYYSTGLNIITLITFKNMFKSGIINEDYKFCEYLIKKYIPYLQLKGNPGLDKFFEAKLKFKYRKYSESLKIITSFNTYNYSLDDHVLIFDAKVLTLQLYSELGYIEDSLRGIDAFNKYLINNKEVLSSRNQHYFRNFLVFYKKLTDIIMDKDNVNIKTLLNELNNSVCTERPWLREKLEGLMNAGKQKN